MLATLTLQGRKNLRITLPTFLTVAVLALVFALSPAVAFADSAYNVYVGGVEVTDANRGDVLGDGTVSFAATGNKAVMTLTNAKIEAKPYGTLEADSYGLYFQGYGEVELVLKGSNSISGSAVAVADNTLTGIMAITDKFTIHTAETTPEDILKNPASLSINLIGNKDTFLCWGFRGEKPTTLSSTELLLTPLSIQNADLSVGLTVATTSTEKVQVTSEYCGVDCGNLELVGRSSLTTSVDGHEAGRVVGVNAEGTMTLSDTSVVNASVSSNAERDDDAWSTVGVIAKGAVTVKNSSQIWVQAINANEKGNSLGMAAHAGVTVQDDALIDALANGGTYSAALAWMQPDKEPFTKKLTVRDNATVEAQGATVAILGFDPVDLAAHKIGGAMVNTNATSEGATQWDKTTALSATSLETAHWRYVRIPEHTHTAGSPVNENVIAPTCTQPGSHDEVVYCTGCGKELSRTQRIDAALGHDWGEWVVTTPATSLTEGVETRTCNVCSTSEDRSIPKLCKITFNPGGGTFGDGSTESKSYEYAKGTVITLPDAPKRTGYTFEYWSSSEYKPGSSYTVTSSLTFTARWKKDSSSSSSTKTSTSSSSSSSSEKLSQTGDYTNMTLPFVLLGVGVAVVGAGIFLRRKK